MRQDPEYKLGTFDCVVIVERRELTLQRMVSLPDSISHRSCDMDTVFCPRFTSEKTLYVKLVVLTWL